MKARRTVFVLLLWLTMLTSNLPIPPVRAQAGSSDPIFDYIVVIILENHSLSNITSSSAPYMKTLETAYANATDYASGGHYSLSQYLKLISGNDYASTWSHCSADPYPNGNCSTSNGSWPYPGGVNDTLVTDELPSTLKWKAYMEDYPGPGTGSAYSAGHCYMESSGSYMASHDPFVYFGHIITSTPNCQTGGAQHTGLVVASGAPGASSCPHSPSDIPSGAASALIQDFNSSAFPSTTPNLAFLIPNRYDDAHDCDVPSANAYLSVIIPKLLSTFTFQNKRAAVIITFDEPCTGGGSTPGCPSTPDDDVGSTPLYFVIAGPRARRAYTSSISLNHYSVLKAIEDNWELAALGSSQGQPNMANFFYPRGDINGDCNINIADLTLIGNAFGSTVGGLGYTYGSDLTNDGRIDIFDLSTVGGLFGGTCL